MHTIPSDRIARVSEEYSLLAFISDEGAAKLQPLLHSLESSFPNAIYSLQHGQLHITITAVMRDITYGKDAREQFLRREQSVIDGIGEVVGGYSPFPVHFNKAIATRDALIVTSPDVATINTLRTDIIRKLSIPYTPATIAHSSIARFKSEIPLEAIASVLENFDVDFTEYISELVLVRETVAPLEKYEVVARFHLA